MVIMQGCANFVFNLSLKYEERAVVLHSTITYFMEINIGGLY
jgi:hypothetical protein